MSSTPDLELHVFLFIMMCRHFFYFLSFIKFLLTYDVTSLLKFLKPDLFNHKHTEFGKLPKICENSMVTRDFIKKTFISALSGG